MERKVLFLVWKEGFFEFDVFNVYVYMLFFMLEWSLFVVFGDFSINFFIIFYKKGLYI